MADGDAAPAGPVVVGEVAVGVEAVAEFVGQLAQFVWAVLAAQASELRLGFLAGLDVNEVRQPLTKAANHRDVTGADLPGAQRLGGGRQPRRQRFTSD